MRSSGVTKIVRCNYCDKAATKLCDYRDNPGADSCDRPLCDEHAIQIGVVKNPNLLRRGGGVKQPGFTGNS